jgi:hypothetical protein
MFSSQSKAVFKGAFFTTAGSGLKFGDSNLSLVQNLSTSMQQPITPLYEIGSNNRYYVVGKSTGNFTIAQILGFKDADKKSVVQQVADMADPCKITNMTLIYPGNTCNAGGAAGGGKQELRLNMTGVLVQSIQITQQAQDNIVTANLAGIFTSMTYGV